MYLSKSIRLLLFIAIALVVQMGVLGAQDRLAGDHFKLNHDGYMTDTTGVNILKNAVMLGYKTGAEQGLIVRNKNRPFNRFFRRNSFYSDGDLGYDPHVKRSVYIYYFREGFELGYDDGWEKHEKFGADGVISDHNLNKIIRAKPVP